MFFIFHILLILICVILYFCRNAVNSSHLAHINRDCTPIVKHGRVLQALKRHLTIAAGTLYFILHVNLCFLYFCPCYLHCQSPNLRLREFIFEYSKIVCVQIQNIYHNSLHIHVCVNNQKGKNTLYTVVDSPHGIS